MSEIDQSKITNKIEKYLELKSEHAKIQKDIKQYRQQFKKRSSELQQEMEIISNLITKYLDEHNHPAINYRGIIINKKESLQGISAISRKKKEDELKKLKKEYNLSDECIDSIHDSIMGPTKLKKSISMKIEKNKK